MTLPSSGPLSFSEIAAELGVSSSGFNIGSAAARSLAGVPSGAISLSEFYGKSAYAPMSPNIGSGDSESGESSTYSWTVTVSENGGVGPYSYSWAIVSQSGAYGSAFFYGSTTGRSVDLVISTSEPFNGWTANVQCTVTDSTSRTVASNVAAYAYATP